MPPKTPGPPPHWHEMHDETFFVTKADLQIELDAPHALTISHLEGELLKINTCEVHDDFSDLLDAYILSVLCGKHLQ